MRKKFYMLVILGCIASFAYNQNFNQLFSFDDFNQWMQNASIPSYSLLEINSEGDPEVLHELEYKARFHKNGVELLSVALNYENAFEEYKSKADKDKQDYYTFQDYEVAYVPFTSGGNYTYSFFAVKIPEINASFIIMCTPMQSKEKMEEIAESFEWYKKFKN